MLALSGAPTSPAGASAMVLIADERLKMSDVVSDRLNDSFERAHPLAQASESRPD
jgi:hypothetical protein